MDSPSTAIQVQNLSKCYRIGLKEKIHDSLGAAVLDFMKSPVKNYRKYKSLYKFDDVKPDSGEDSDGSASDIIWALRDVSFKVARGELLGIIGRNGAGKSTLLKILSKITDPTTGLVEIRGRVSSLLEVGTGFHQELTGRENIYLNGTVLGMTRKEVNQKFDEIVDFSGVEKFLDTPVKRYSSGMKVRLAFSVAAHLEPEILLIDEVLAVGDARFQKKCLDKMDDVGRRGRTVIFVSHNMPAVTRLCQRAILLDEGRVLANGPSDQIVSTYLSSGTSTTALREWTDLKKAPGTELVRLLAVRVKTEDGRLSEAIDIRQPVAIEMEYEIYKAGSLALPYYDIFNQEGMHIFTTVDQDPEWRKRPRPAGRYISTAWIPGNLLSEGMLLVNAVFITLDPNELHYYERDAVAFYVTDSIDGNSARGDWVGSMSGAVRPLLKWTTQFDPIERRTAQRHI